MFAVARHFNDRETKQAFRLFVYWSMRFLVVGGRSGLLDRNYAVAAQKIGLKRITTANGLTNALFKIVPSDALFEASFSEARVSAKSLARYHLRALDQQRKEMPEPEWVPSDEETAINFEHVLPENPQDMWSHIAPETANANYRRIGNMVLMQAKKNSLLGNGSFETKSAVSKDSTFELTSPELTRPLSSKRVHYERCGGQSRAVTSTVVRGCLSVLG